ncbi:KipI family sensor histidine kinase inhibitor [Marmoricola sp. OAE513]|uniref:5-oxoprolinase subunit B family protein n=1 Tax=Marmoricola sp. OAE513 TaxID=2817894 RepID=UPI001AE67767
MEALRVGQHALLVECASDAQVAATYAMVLARAGELGATDVVPAARSVLLDGLADVAAALTLLAGLTAPLAEESAHVGHPEGLVVQLPTSYDGPDLDEVARQWDVTTAEVVALHRRTTFVVTFCGFAPGFAYCSGLPDGLDVARRSEPRASVRPGSVGLAGAYTGVYPSSSPGGWQLIGTTTATLWRPDADQPALLTPGTRVRFVDG